MKTIKCLALAAAFAVNVASAQALPKSNGVAEAPDDWMLASTGPRWWYQSQPSITPVMLDTRKPTKAEQQVIDRATKMMTQYPMKAIALIDGDKVVHQDFNAPAGPASTIFGFSMGKTITSLMVGQAICDGKLSLTTRADELIPELKGKQLGAATVRDLLRMASGTRSADSGGGVLTPDTNRGYKDGTLNLIDVLATDANAGPERGVFSDWKVGEHFSYKDSNPLTLGMMVSRATGVSYVQWLQAKVLDPAGVAEKGLVAQDKKGDGAAMGAVRLKMDDWIRFAVWVKKSSEAKGCFGDYVREATKTQIANGPSKKERKTGNEFAGYGYLTWTDNEVAPDSYWAVGYGGQRIGWFKDSNKIIIVFSNREDWMPELYALGKAWNKAAE